MKHTSSVKHTTTDYWDDPELYERRNMEMYQDKKAGMNNVELVKKYGITPQRIQQIYNKFLEKELQEGI